eukprot:COSAG05_NODE_11_length_38500_cov_831.349861_41_plen_173_part_00
MGWHRDCCRHSCCRICSQSGNSEEPPRPPTVQYSSAQARTEAAAEHMQGGQVGAANESVVTALSEAGPATLDAVQRTRVHHGCPSPHHRRADDEPESVPWLNKRVGGWRSNGSLLGSYRSTTSERWRAHPVSATKPTHSVEETIRGRTAVTPSKERPCVLEQRQPRQQPEQN